MKNVGWKVSINCLIYAHKQTKTLSGGIFNSPVWLLSEEKGEEGRKSMEYVLELKNIYKSFPGVKVLEDVTLQVRPGEVHALMGENGAGKSTLMKILLGIYKAGQGSIFLEGKETAMHGPKDAMSKGISMIHQELNTVLDMEVAENVFVGRELLKKGMEKLKIVDIARMREETGRYFREMNIDIDPRAKMRTLSVAEMQLVEIVKAISLNSKIIVMDEPTSAITEKEAAVLFTQIERLKKQGVAIIYISHKMDEIFEICDQVSVLRDGALVMTKNCSDTNMNELISAMVGRSLDNRFPPVDNTPGDVILRVEHLSTKYAPKLQDITFDVKKGEIFGLYGLVGAGRTELLETIFGIRTRAAGRVYYDDKLMNFHSSKDAMDHGFALITEERKADGLFLKADITFNTTIANMSQYKSGIALSKDEMVRATAEEIRIMHTKCMGPDDMIANLSGGNQQKAIFGRWLERSPKIFMMDDPTRGIDVGAKYEIYELIIDMAKQGKTIIVVSSEMPEILGITNRIGVMSNGHLAGIVNTKETNQEELLRLSAKYL